MIDGGGERLRIVVVGAGVIGLTSAVALLGKGHDVTVVAESRMESTCSANAGAIWGPFLSEGDNRVFGWSFQTLEKLRALTSDTSSGVYLVDGVLAADYDTDMPEWFHMLKQNHEYDEELPSGYVRGWRYKVPIIDMPRYLSWLEGEVYSGGGRFLSKRVEDLDAEASTIDYVINCTGLGARDLCNDDGVYPVKGQLVVVRNPGIKNFFAERGDLTNLFYWMPQSEKIVLGGTAEDQFSHNGIDQSQVDRILSKAKQIDKRFSGAEILDFRVGFRPCRKFVRFEFDPVNPKIFHNYGHGGSGVSLSWGCAHDLINKVFT